MSIFEFAYEMESNSENYYRYLAESSQAEGLKKILLMLAEEEKKHKEILLAMKDGAKVKFPDSSVLKDAKKVFKNLQGKYEIINDEVKQKELYLKALGFEKESKDFYLKKAEETTSTEEKEIFSKLAAEEEKHFFLISNLVEYVAKPEYWVENGEFNHLDDEF
jgi:rubrerythrin